MLSKYQIPWMSTIKFKFLLQFKQKNSIQLIVAVFIFIELTLIVMEVKKLIGPANVEHLDTFVRIYLTSHESECLQTMVNNNSQTN